MTSVASGDPDQGDLRRRRGVWTEMADSRGFTLIEILVVLVLMVILLAITALVFSGYQERTSARQAAILFGRDLTLARSAALRGRERVTIRFDEPSQEYQVLREAGDTLFARRYSDGSDIELSQINLNLPGDSLWFDSRGIVDLSGASGSLGTAEFRAGGTAYTLSFNSMGASRVEIT
jgi:prepilin-type N-terminal cleavage/methylation domain-containing protein